MKPTLLTPWYYTSNIQRCQTINLCFLRHSTWFLAFCSRSPRKLIQGLLSISSVLKFEHYVFCLLFSGILLIWKYIPFSSRICFLKSYLRYLATLHFLISFFENLHLYSYWTFWFNSLIFSSQVHFFSILLLFPLPHLLHDFINFLFQEFE